VHIRVFGLVRVILLAMYNVIYENWSPDRSFKPRLFTYNVAVIPP